MSFALDSNKLLDDCKSGAYKKLFLAPRFSIDYIKQYPMSFDSVKNHVDIVVANKDDLDKNRTH